MNMTRAFLLICSVLVFSTYSSMAQSPEKKSALTVKEIKALIAKLAPLQAEFEPGSWSQSHPEEKLQTFDAYVADRGNVPNPNFKTLYIQQIGELTQTHEKIIDTTSEFLSAFFNAPVKNLDKTGDNVIPQSATRKWGVGGKQFLAGYILDKILLPKRPKDAIAVLGLTAIDLWPGEGWNYVFGLASLDQRIGVWSLARYGNSDEGEKAFQLFLLRTLTRFKHFQKPSCS